VHVTLSLNAADPNHVRRDKVTDINLSFCLYQLWPQAKEGVFLLFAIFHFQSWISFKASVLSG